MSAEDLNAELERLNRQNAELKMRVQELSRGSTWRAAEGVGILVFRAQLIFFQSFFLFHPWFRTAQSKKASGACVCVTPCIFPGWPMELGLRSA